MGMVAPEQRIASAFVVFCGGYGDVRRQALERGVCRQRLYQEAGKKSAALLEVLDELTRPCVQQVVADEIYVSRPALMMVEPESLCWVTGHLTEHVDGLTWAEEFERLPHLEQVTRDAGSGLT